MRKHGVDKHIKLCHEVVQAVWHADTAKWHVDVRDLAADTPSFTVKADFVVSAIGRLNSATLPDIDGLADFAGTLVHTARWCANLTPNDKRVAVIGNGASGMQILPAIQPHVQRLVHFARTRNWVSAAFNGGLAAQAAEPGNPGGRSFSLEEREAYASDEQAYLAYRRSLDTTFHNRLDAFYKDSPASTNLRKDLTALMAKRVDNDSELLARLVPDYAPLCKRLTPAPGYLEALHATNVDYVTERITRVTKDTIETADGASYAVDVIVAATGFPLKSGVSFPVYGRDGADLGEVWAGNATRNYFGVMAPRFPNFFFVLQHTGTAFGGTVPLQAEQTATYIAQCIRKLQAQAYAALEPTEAATDDFDAVLEGFFADKVTTDSCSSWWKQGSGPSRVTVAWPGTGHHKWDISRFPRWEDFSFQRRPETQANRFAYFNAGNTTKEVRGDAAELTAYLTAPSAVNLATLHESWTLGY